MDVSPIVKLISEGVNEPAPLPPTNENDKPKNGTKTKPAKKLFGVTVNNNTKATKPISSANLWNEQNAAKYNVKITRPSHDRWGIKKIVLMFCDDFLHTTYTLPWYQEGNKNPSTTTISTWCAVAAGRSTTMLERSSTEHVPTSEPSTAFRQKRSS